MTDDDEPVRMTAEQRRVVAYLATVVITSGVYFTLIVRRLLTQPLAEISWVRPMIWALAVSIIGTILITIGLGITSGGRDQHPDVRDKEIGRIGSRASFAAMSAGTAGALILSMVDADGFWIGNLLFLCGTAGAIAETVTKLRLYRNGWA